MPLCVFGHMHSRLARGAGRRAMVAAKDGTVHVNAAEVPRHRPSAFGDVDVHFTLVDLDGAAVSDVRGVWLHDDAGVVEERVLWRRGG